MIFQSCLFAITAVVLKALIGFILAHLMHNIPGKNQRIWRGLLLVPWVIPLALSTLTWWWMFDPSYSAFNWVLNAVRPRNRALARAWAGSRGSAPSPSMSGTARRSS